MCCVGCAYLIKERRKTWNKYITLKAKYDEMIKVRRSKGIYILYLCLVPSVSVCRMKKPCDMFQVL